MRLLHRLHLLIYLVSSLVPASMAEGSSAATLVMPRDLVEFARSNRCAPLDDFFDRPGMVNPPYACGLLPGDEEDSAVLWCKKLEASDKPYLLLIKVSNTTALLGCPARLDWWNPPGGLSIETRARISLGNFRYLGDPRRSAAGSVARGRVIVSSYDGATEAFYCHKGEWLVEMKH